MSITKTLAAVIAALVISSGVSMAETNAPAASAKPAASADAPAKPAKMAKLHKAHTNVATRSEASKACSAQADAQKLHGQPRREFRKSCLKTAAAKAPAAKPQAMASVKPAAKAASAAH